MYLKLINWLAGDESLTEINRIFNVACTIGGLFSFLSGIECLLVGLSPVLVASNFIFTAGLGIAYYFSRTRKDFRVWRGVVLFILIFIYTPILWIFNGGIYSATPYFILLFISFLTILTIARKKTRASTILRHSSITIFILVVTGLIILEFQFPELIYRYTDPFTHMIDVIVGVVFASIGNYLILMAFVHLYYRQLEKVEELAVRDSMTCLYNHIYVVNRLTEEIERASRYGSPLSIIILDIDHFKKINDTFGHLEGDKVLQEISRIIKSNCRSIDMIGRYGGDEFLIILPDTSKNMAVVIGNRLLEKIRELASNENIPVTISAGIAQFHSGNTTTNLIEKADQNLYLAKTSGRDQIKS